MPILTRIFEALKYKISRLESFFFYPTVRMEVHSDKLLTNSNCKRRLLPTKPANHIIGLALGHLNIVTAVYKK